MTTPHRILLATDLSGRCDRALDRAAALACAWNAELVVVHAIQQSGPASTAPSWRRAPDPRALALDRVRADLRDPPPHLTIVVEYGEPASVIVEAVERFGCDLVVTGVARNETLGRWLLGTTVDALLRRASVPILVVKARPGGPYRSVVVASDFSEPSRSALERALATFPEARVTLFHAFDVPYEGMLADRTEARDAGAEAARRDAEAFLAATPAAAGRHIPVLCEYGRPGPLLDELVQTRGVDLVVVGTHGRGWLARTLLGSVAETLVGEVPGDVLVVRQPA